MIDNQAVIRALYSMASSSKPVAQCEDALNKFRVSRINVSRLTH